MMQEAADYMEKARQLVERALDAESKPDIRDSRVMALALLAIAVALIGLGKDCLLYTSPSPRDRTRSRMPSSA